MEQNPGQKTTPNNGVEVDQGLSGQKTSQPDSRREGRSGAALVAAGILLSRIIGLIRERVFAHYFGNTASADAFKAALRIPNFLQNLFGEGVLSASFIPAYSSLLGKKQVADANRLATGVLVLLAWTVCLLVLIGVIFSPQLVALIAPGFSAEKRDLTIQLTRILFPAMGFLVLSAWCLGVLNSHRNFFLPYAAPVCWNLVIIIGLVIYRDLPQDSLAETAAWSVVVGSLAQLLIQVPTVYKLLGEFRPKLFDWFADLAEVVRNFFPAMMSRGVIQVSAYVDSILASLLPTGAVAALSYMQTIYLLPISLFSASVSAAELPELSQIVDNREENFVRLKKRIASAHSQVSYFIIPTAVAFLVLGDLLIGVVFETGSFGRKDTIYVWQVLAGASLGLYWTATGRLYSSTFFALRNTLTPFRCSILRLALSTLLGAVSAIFLPRYLGLPPEFGLVCLATASAIVGIVDHYLLKYLLQKQIGKLELDLRKVAVLWAIAFVGAIFVRLAAAKLGFTSIILLATFCSLSYGIFYLGATKTLRFEEANKLFKVILKNR